MSFKELDIQIRYRSETHNFPRDFLIPVLSQTKLYKRGTGYFSTTALIQLSYGLFEMAKKGGRICLICSPQLDASDIEAINYGYDSRERVIENSIIKSIIEPINEFEEERLNLIATLIANGTLDIKIAFLDDENGFRLYHEKIAVFEDYDGNKISYAGSVNESAGGLDGNFESIYTFCSWKDASQIEAVTTSEQDFDQMWSDKSSKLRIIPFPKIATEKLLKYKKSTGVNWQLDEQEFNNDIDTSIGLQEEIKPVFYVPEGVVMHSYQDAAIAKWNENNHIGIFDMCTGAGKTYTALKAMVDFANDMDNKLATFIVCPYIHLVSQWEEDVLQWCNVNIIIAHSKSPNKDWKEELFKAYKRFKKDRKPFICITTNDTFAGSEIQKYVTRFNEEQEVLIIVDEAHNFGTSKMIDVMPWNIKNRIALSATIDRYMDKAGTTKIYEYFGDRCIRYSLDEAIKDGNLVHYEYYPIPVALNRYELKKYSELTKKLSKYLTQKDGKLKMSEAGQFIVYERTRLLAAAENKIKLLMDIIDDYKKEKYILVYCGAANICDEDSGEIARQIDVVTNMLQTEYGMSVKRFTSEENLVERQDIKNYFEQGIYQVVTAIKCLDEGVNIPGIKTAIIMSSSRNPKEFVQRRGRLLRKCKNKNKAVIYDFITLPRELCDIRPENIIEDKTIIVGEIARMMEFGRLADNSEVTDELVNKIMSLYEYYFNPEDEMKKMEDYYGE